MGQGCCRACASRRAIRIPRPPASRRSLTVAVNARRLFGHVGHRVQRRSSSRCGKRHLDRVHRNRGRRRATRAAGCGSVRGAGWELGSRGGRSDPSALAGTQLRASWSGRLESPGRPGRRRGRGELRPGTAPFERPVWAIPGRCGARRSRRGVGGSRRSRPRSRAAIRFRSRDPRCGRRRPGRAGARARRRADAARGAARR